MKIAITAFLLAKRNVEVNQFCWMLGVG